MRIKCILFLLVFLLSQLSGYRTAEASLDARIRRVEEGLRSSYADPPWETMSLRERMAHYSVPGVSIAVINDGRVEWARGYGVLEAGGEEPVTPETLFQTASLAKPVIAVAAMHCVESELLDLDQDVNDLLRSWHVPENRYTEEARVTLRGLLSHSAGVTVGGFRGYALGEELPTLQQVLDGEPPANSPPVRVDIVPGTQHRYSGGGYMIVQQLLEDITGQPFAQILQISVLDPWGMQASTFESPLPTEFQDLAASGHRSDGRAIPGGWHTYPEMGSGASMWSTASDMAQFAIQMMEAYGGASDPVLSHEIAVLMLTPQIEERGLGPLVYDDGGDRFYFMHPGKNDGYQNVLVAYPKKGQGVVILTNSDNGEALWREILNSVSVEYGWVRANTGLYVAGVVVLFIAPVALWLWRRAGRKGDPL